jgi:hypothetical protein
MSSSPKRSLKGLTTFVVVIGVFGLAVLMIVEQYDPTVIITVITGTSFAASELVRRLQAS